jgi:hypothetical protein
MRGMLRHVYWKRRIAGRLDKPMVGVEVGVQFGLNAVETLLYLPRLTLHVVDNFSRHDSVPAREVAEYNLAPFGDRVVWHVKDSVIAASDFEDGSLDYIYIDASHDFESVKNDIAAWYPKAKEDAYFGGHDYFEGGVVPQEPVKPSEVRDAVLRVFRNVHYKPAPADWWIIKGDGSERSKTGG